MAYSFRVEQQMEEGRHAKRMQGNPVAREAILKPTGTRKRSSILASNSFVSSVPDKWERNLFSRNLYFLPALAARQIGSGCKTKGCNGNHHDTTQICKAIICCRQQEIRKWLAQPG